MLMRWVGRRVIALHLVHVQRDAADIDALTCKERNAVIVVARHVDAAGVVIAEVDQDALMTHVQRLLEALAGTPRLGDREVTLARHVRHGPAAAGALDDRRQRFLLHPDLDVDVLPGPLIQREVALDLVEDRLLILFDEPRLHTATTILDAIPVEIAGHAAVSDQAAEVLVCTVYSFSTTFSGWCLGAPAGPRVAVTTVDHSPLCQVIC
jgi:hypothetical protein